jgi:hypothetical protein
MKSTHTSMQLLAALAFGCTAAFASAAPVINPFAANLTAGAYSQDRAAPGTSAQSVFDGGYWNAGTWGVHWVQADMGSVHTLSEVRLVVDVSPATSTWQEVFISDQYIGFNYGQLTPLASRSGLTTQFEPFDLHFTPQSGRFLEVVSYGGASWTALGGGARVDWVDQGSGGGSVPEPASLALTVAALGVLGALRLRRRA